ncbi:hypothetical protein AQUCO_01200164v1 [Aquilegia coerulea]|uniref:Uncharacterized protein n=1 Tax=Aquilegia coerulea TaxID=218851 RepID=A0A2G5E4S1_AQUCA|nr:hypothetical protein AQUCO_01200164v1 [Aquilegia coerulea]
MDNWKHWINGLLGTVDRGRSINFYFLVKNLILLLLFLLCDIVIHGTIMANRECWINSLMGTSDRGRPQIVYFSF